MPAARKDKVVLYSPHFASEATQGGNVYRSVPPLSNLHVAGPIRDAGYDVTMIDARWDKDWQDTLSQQRESLACVGITSLTGPSVADGLTFATHVRALAPDIPIIWGGWHASFAAHQAASDLRVGVVVRGMGESTIVEILTALKTGRPLTEIRGISFRNGEAIVETPDRPLEDIALFPPPAYDLVDCFRYIHEIRPGVRHAATIFSRGCPFACDFCLDSGRRWRGLPIERMIADIEFWIGCGVNLLTFYDGNFFLGRKRIVKFCKAVLDRGLESRFRWNATAVANRKVQMDDNILGLLSRAGLNQVAIGAESGSPELLRRITNKTTVGNTIEAVKRLTGCGVNQYLFFVVGYPDEPPDALDKTFSLILKLKSINPNCGVQVNFTTPLPDSTVYRYAVANGLIAPPRTFEDWAKFDYTTPNVPQFSPDYSKKVLQFVRDLAIAYPDANMQTSSRTEWVKIPIRRVVRWRLKQTYGSAKPKFVAAT